MIVAMAAPFLCGCGGKASGGEEDGKQPCETETVDTVIVRREYGIAVDSFDMEEHRVKEGEAISTIFSRAGAPDDAINRLLTIPDSVFDVRRVRAGNKYTLFYTPDSVRQLTYVVYHRSLTDFVVFHLEDSLHVERFEKPVTRVERTSSVTINNSLWGDVNRAGLNVALALDLSDIYAWTIDFFGLQAGDSFTACYDEEYVDSVAVGIGRIYAARFTHNGKDCYAIYYGNDSVEGYWDLDGNNVKKAFLKAPLKFSRISSHFTYARRHPVYKTVRPHTGVDYAAPKGTPVMAIGDGTVTYRGYSGGGGNMVKIRHNSTYQSAYLHLSKFGKGVAVGERVTQGQVIGYVGSTGASTGPHLDFRVWKNGQPINPLTMEAPPTEPLPEQYRAEFDSVKNVMLERIAAR